MSLEATAELEQKSCMPLKVRLSSRFPQSRQG
jgi:hypothetical protein